MSTQFIASALESRDIAELMQGYVLALYEDPSTDRQTVLAALQSRMSEAGGNLELAGCIAQSAYEHFLTINDTEPWDMEREAVAGVYLGLIHKAVKTNQLELAEAMADRAAGQFRAGSREEDAVLRTRQEIRLRMLRQRASGDLGRQSRPGPTLAEVAATVRAKLSASGASSPAAAAEGVNPL